MAQFYDWKYLNEEQVNEFDRETDEANLRKLISQHIHIPFSNPKHMEFALRFHLYNFLFCKEEAFDARKTSTLMSIMNDMFLNDMTTSAPSNTMTQSFTAFKNIIIVHSVQRPPKSIQVFDHHEVPSILKYAIDSYYRRYRLYKYLYTAKLVQNFKQVLPQEVEYTRAFPPLADAILLKTTETATENDVEDD